MKILKRIKWGNILDLLVLVASSTLFIVYSIKLMFWVMMPFQFTWFGFAMYMISPFVSSSTYERIYKNFYTKKEHTRICSNQ